MERNYRQEIKEILKSHLRQNGVLTKLGEDEIESMLADIVAETESEVAHRINSFGEKLAVGNNSVLREKQMELEEYKCKSYHFENENKELKAKLSGTHKDSVVRELERKLSNAKSTIYHMKSLVKASLDSL